ncbi:gas vesicle protein GvpN [Candidatus Parcubacteria bacterium]|nr:gas vesicle protein GvpN [Candidatus Parcubacteria bacterium]
MPQAQMGEITTVLEPRPLADFVETDYINDLTDRALTYVTAGFPIHLRGVSGTGKTTLAFHIASKIGRPVVMIHGDEQFTTSDLVGGEYGYRLRKVVDNFIHSVLKTEEDMTRRWVDNRLTVACKYGFTLIYDEFTRSRPEANNVLLSVLQEKMLDLPAAREGGEDYLRVDPKFTAIFTSNPEEYAGVYKAQDALRDRMVTMDLSHFDRETEIAITEAKTGLPRDQAGKIVDIVRGLRNSGKYEFAPTVRGCIYVGKALKIKNGSVGPNGFFRTLCGDILTSETSRVGSRTNQEEVKKVVNQMIGKYCGPFGREAGAAKRASGRKKTKKDKSARSAKK